MLPPRFPRQELQRLMNFGALSRGFGTCCLRFKTGVATTPARLASGCLARLYPEGVEPSGSLQKVSDRSLFLDLSWRKGSFIVNLPLASSLDHLVGEREQLGRKLDAERFGGLEIDDELELSRLHHRQVGRLLALEDATGVHAKLAIRFPIPGCVTDETTSRNELPLKIGRGNRVTRGQIYQRLAVTDEQRIVANEKRSSPLLNKGCKRRLEVAFVACGHNLDLLTNSVRGLLRVFRPGCNIRVVRVHEHGNQVGGGHQPTKQFQPFAQQRA